MTKPSRRQLAEAVLALLDSHASQAVAKALAGYLVANQRSKELDAIMRDIESLRKNRQGIVEATAVSAFELTSATKKELERMLGGKKNHIVYRHDPTVIGGVRVQALDWQLDTTVATKLKQLKHLTAKTN